jgi:CBS domain-containing protein
MSTAPNISPATALPPILTVAEIMTTVIHTVNPEMTVREAIALLLEHKISGAPVCDSGRKVMSVVSEGDLLKLAAGVGMEKTIFQCMSKLKKTAELLTVGEKDSFAALYKLFLTHSVHRIIVVDQMGRLDGLVSRSNILRVLAGEKGDSSAQVQAKDSKSSDSKTPSDLKKAK